MLRIIRRRLSLGAAIIAVAGFGAASRNANAAIIIDDFNTSHSATVTVLDPPRFPMVSATSGVATSALGGARMLTAYVVSGQEDDQYRLRVAGTAGLVSVETSALVRGKSLVTYNGRTSPGSPVIAGNFRPPSHFNLPVTDITQSGANNAVVVRANADNNGIPLIFTIWVNANVYARGTLQLPGTASGALRAYSLDFDEFVATGATLSSILTGVRAITLELDGLRSGVTPGTDVILDYVVADIAVPEPATYALLGGALLSLVLFKRRAVR